MKIPEQDLESTVSVLRSLVDERTSAPWAEYDDDDLSMDNQDYEDAESVRTVLDVLRWLRDQGSRRELVEYDSCLDPLGNFDIEDVPEEEDPEMVFRKYLSQTYSIDPAEFPG